MIVNTTFCVVLLGPSMFRGLNAFAVRNMSYRVFLDPSPPTYTGVKGTLDKSAFRKSLDVLAAKVPATQTGILLKADSLKRYLATTPLKGF